MSDDRDDQPSKGAWLLATLAMIYAVCGLFVVFGDLALTTFRLDTISLRTLHLSIRQPWTAGVITFLAFLPWAMLGGHLWGRADSYEGVSWAGIGVSAALMLGMYLGFKYFGQVP